MPSVPVSPRKRRNGFIFFGWLVLVLILAVKGNAGAGEDEKKSPKMLMPRVGVGVEYGGFLKRGEDYSSAFRYQVLVDLFKWRRNLLYLEIDGEISFGIPSNNLAFNRIRHHMALLGYRFDLGNYYLGPRLYHRCHNPFKERGRLIGSRDRNLTNIYFIGLQLVDKAMLVGQKDRGIVFDPARPFEFLGRWHVAGSVDKVLHREFCDLDWLFQGRVRFDIFRYRRLVPYIEAGGEVLGRTKSWWFIPRVEGGVRFHAGYLTFTPFLQWGRTQEWKRLFYNQTDTQFVSKSYLFGGGRLEFLLDKETLAARPLGEGLQFFPEVHGQAEYAFYLGSTKHLTFAKVDLELYFLRWQLFTLFVNLGTDLSSFEDNAAPFKVWYRLDYGVRYAWRDFFVEGFVRHARRLDAHDFFNVRESAHLAGGRVGTRGILLGHYDDGISFEGPESFQWLHKLNAEVRLAHYFDTQDWPYLWNLASQVRWDVLRWRFMIPYLQGGLEWRAAHRGSRDRFDYYVEPGLRFHGVMDLAVFYRFQHQETLFTAGGPKENQSLIGIRALF